MGDIDLEMVAAKEALDELQWLISRPERSDERWRQKIIDLYTKFAQATGIVARDSDPFGPLDFLAKILYEHDCHARGVVPIRWHKLQVNLLEQFRQQAIQTVASWANEELQMQRLSGITPIVPRRR